MAKMIFSHDFIDKETNELVKANTEVDYTLKRADEIVENIQKQLGAFPNYVDFGYKRTDKK